MLESTFGPKHRWGLTTGVEGYFGTVVPKSWVAPWCQVTIFQMAPVTHLYQIGTSANFLNGTGAGANFSNSTGAKHLQTWHRCQILNGTSTTPLPNWHRCQFSKRHWCWCQFFKWHRCQTFSNFGTGANFLHGTNATASQTWHQYQFVKWYQYRCTSVNDFSRLRMRALM